MLRHNVLAAIASGMLVLGLVATAHAQGGVTSLHFAVERDDLKAAERLVRAGANVNEANRFGLTPLAIASGNANASMIELLLKSGADANAGTADGETPLMTAASTGSASAVRLLLTHGAQVNVADTWKGQTALMRAAAGNHAAVARALLDAGADVRAASKGKYTSFMFALREGAIDVARLLLNAGASPNDKAPDGTSAMVVALINGNFELAALLLDQGADPNAVDARGSALHTLAWARKPGVTNDPRSFGPIVSSGRLDSLGLARALLSRGANPNARIAWEEIPFDPDDGEVKSPPNMLVGRDYLSLVGATPFFLAAKNGDLPLMQLLVANGADPFLPTRQNVTPLMAAAGLGYWAGESPGPLNVTSEAERLAALKYTVALGGDVNAAADFGDVRIEGDSQQLLYGYPSNLTDYVRMGDIRWAGSTALHGAALAEGQPSIVRFLVEHGAKLDATNKIGWTPLMVVEGVVYGGTVHYDQELAGVFRALMIERGLDPALYGQRRAAPRQATK